MWWLDPGKEILNVLFNRILAPYIENLDMNQVNYGIGQGQLTLHKLRLRKGALDKFRLPVDVVEGHLGKFTLSLHWMNLGNQPVEILIEDVYLLVVPIAESVYDPEEEEKRMQAAKFERLENAELLHLRGEAEQVQADQQQAQGLISSLITKIINNLQVTIKNIHIRYEDKISVPGHPFAAGVTLAGFTARSVDELWQPAFINSTASVIHKLAKLESLAVYFDTDATSLAGLSHKEFVEKFTKLIAKSKELPDHQFVLQPVTGEGRIKMNHEVDKQTPKFDVQLLFDQIGVILDDNQYRDAISLVDMYHFYIRRHQYYKFRPSQQELEENKPRALLRFATTAILEEVRERMRTWTWSYFAERRDDRHQYVDIFKQKLMGTLNPTDAGLLEALEKKLCYEDIRFYRSIARSQLRKDRVFQQKQEEERKKQQKQQQQSSWTSWIWGSSGTAKETTPADAVFTGEMTEEQRKELYEVLDYDEKAAVAEAFQTSRDALKARVNATLNRASLALKIDPHGLDKEIISVVSESLQSSFIQRPDNFEVSLSLGDFAVRDGTTANTLYPLIVHVQESKSGLNTPVGIQDEKQVQRPNAAEDPFLFLKFENKPLDERADSALTVRMRYMEIVYHKGYVEAVYSFFRPPASQLQSVEALLDVANQTLEGIRRETRAGLEYALQTHKTVDVQMDLNAPIIIIPEDITTNSCKHLVIDAGHIAIESELANKQAIHEIQSKRKKQYTDEDYKRLESMMYDRLSVRLESAQFLIGNDLQSCLEALTSNSHDNLHLLERINIDLTVHNSIVPTAYTLPRFKVSGRLPTLKVNLSDIKYKSLMRLIDVAIPKFEDDDDDSGHRPPPKPVAGGPQPKTGFKLPSGFFGTSEQEYNVDDDDHKEADSRSPAAGEDVEGDEQFFEAEAGTAEQDPQLQQHIFELAFHVDTLRASLFRSTSDGNEREVGNVSFGRFSLDFSMAKFVMKADVNLKSLSVNVVQPGKEPLEFVSSEGASTEDDLLIVKYVRAQQRSPEFHTTYEGIDQSVDIKLSTLLFRAAPEPVISVYDFIMITFVPQRETPPAVMPTPDSLPENGSPVSVSEPGVARGAVEKIRVYARLASVDIVLINDDCGVATLSLSTGDVTVLLRGRTMRVNARLGSLSVTDDSSVPTSVPDFKNILSIEGGNFADFQYQTFDPADKELYEGYNSSIYLSTGSLKVHYLEQPLHDLYLFTYKLAEFKGLYDAATEAAVQRASEVERMQFNILIKTPIIIFPSDAQESFDVLTMRLGEFKAHNSYDDVGSHIEAGISGIQLASKMHYDKETYILKMIDDINIIAKITQFNGIDRSKDVEQPDIRVTVNVSDIRLQLTQVQYCLLVTLSQSFTRVVDVTSSTTPTIQPSPKQIEDHSVPSESDTVALQPEIHVSDDRRHIWCKVDVVMTVSTVKLHVYEEGARSEDDLKSHGIVRLALNDTKLRAKMLSDGALESQVVLKSFTMGNTRLGNSRFREIIPAAQHNRDQVMILYTMSGGPDKAALAVITVDSIQMILAVEPVIALLGFFLSAFPSNVASTSEAAEQVNPSTEEAQASGVNFRLDLHDVSISILEDDTEPDTQAIRLSIDKVLLSQQGITAASIDRLGMSLLRMGKSSESVRFLDDIDLTFSLDSRASAAQQMTSIELSTRSIVFRASYRDINLISSIVNKALNLYAKSTQAQISTADQSGQKNAQSTSVARSTTRTSVSQRAGRAKVLTTKEQIKVAVDGFRLVLIGDLHEQPMLHLRVKPFVLIAKNWSGELHAAATLTVHLSYWNLTNSHWEPLIDPWTFSPSVSRDVTGGMTLSVASKERLNANISTTFVELAVATVNVMSKEGEQVLRSSRGTYAPYRIVNRTGYPLLIWSDIEDNSGAKDTAATQINHGQTVDWRFDDWKTMREHASSTGHNNIGLRFIGKQWDQLRSIPVDREGEYTFSLRPRTEKLAYRLLCDVQVQDAVKIVTLRSTYKVENNTLYPLEITLVDESGQPAHPVEKIPPGKDYALPIEAVSHTKVRIQPDQGFGYKWSPAIRWEDLISKRSFSIRCPHSDPDEAAFRFQAWVETDVSDIQARYPKISLKLRAPIELENLLPYNLEYRIYNKDTDQNWRSYLRKGGIMPVHSVELRHLVLLNVNVQDTPFKPSDFAIINTDGSSDFDVEKRVTLRDEKDRKLDLRLNYVKYPNSGGCFKVQIYSPYLVVNKTGLPFSVKPARGARIGGVLDVAGETRPDILSQPIPFMISHPSDQGKDFAFKVGDSVWSQPISLEAPAADTRLVIPSQSQRADEFHVGLSWSEGQGKYKLSTVITLAPRFMVRNASSEPIAFREHGAPPKGRSTLKPGERCPLHVTRAGDIKLLTFAFPGLNARWSAPINIEDIGSVHFRMKPPGDDTTDHLMRADVKLGGSTIFIAITRAAEGWPFKIENDSDYTFTVYQIDSEHPDIPPTNNTLRKYTLSRKSSVDYAWDYPAGRDKKLMLFTGKSKRAIDIMEIGDLVPFKFSEHEGTGTVSLDIRAEGHKQVLRITNYNPEVSLYKPKRRGSLVRQESIGSQEAFEAVQEEIPPTLTFKLDLEGLGLSLINRRLVEVVYLSANNLKTEYSDSTVAQAVTFSCGNIQMDNQLHDALYPVVLQPTPIPKDASVGSLPTIQASVIWLKDQEHGVFFVKYCSILLQALTVEADEDFLFALYDLTKVKGASWDEGQEDILIPQGEEVVEPEAATEGEHYYFEVLELQPIKLSISFMRTERVSSEEKLSIRNPLAVVINAITMAVGNVNDAPLEMNALAIKDMRLTLPDLQQRVMYHYRQEVLRQLYRILGSADFIGNPVGLFTNVSSGVADIFYEPFNGAVMRGDKDLGIGIAKGAASFVKKTVFGFSDSFTRITSSVGKGLSAATFDSEYQMRRRLAQRRNKPRHAIYGVAAGAEAFASSLASGVEGVVLKPVEGAETEGAKGFFKGIGKGLVGVVTKPVVGVFDLAANVGEGIRNTTTVFDKPARERVRLPRHVPFDGVLVPYSEREALGQYWLKDLNSGAYRDELYVAHINIPGGDNVVLLTTSKVLSFWSNRLRLEWELPFNHVQGVTIEDTGIRFAHKGGKEHDKFVMIPDKTAQNWFFSQVAAVVKSFNARRRMDS